MTHFGEFIPSLPNIQAVVGEEVTACGLEKIACELMMAFGKLTCIDMQDPEVWPDDLVEIIKDCFTKLDEAYGKLEKSDLTVVETGLTVISIGTGELPGLIYDYDAGDISDEQFRDQLTDLDARLTMVIDIIANT